MKPLAFCTAAAICLAASSTTLHAQWSSDPADNLGISAGCDSYPNTLYKPFSTASFAVLP